MGITVLIRNKNDRNIENCLASFEKLSHESYELVIIDSSDQPLDVQNFHVNATYLHTTVTRFEALKLALGMSSSDKILIIDSDQVVSPTLIEQLNTVENDMCIVSERSLNRNFVGRLSDLHRDFLYGHSKHNVSETLPVIPRFYRKPLLQKAIGRIGDEELSVISQHEDSIIFSEALKISDDVGFCDIPILNLDPSFPEFARKSFKYGVFQARALASVRVDPERKRLLKSIDRNRVIYSDTQGFNTGILYDALKAIFYIVGLICGKVSGAV